LIANSNIFSKGLPIKSHALISPNSLDIFAFSKKDYQLLVDSMIALVHVFENLLEK